MLDRIVMYLVQARYYLESSLAISMGIFLVALLLMWIISRYGLKRKMNISIKNMIITYLLLLYIIVILKITGILGMSFKIVWFLDAIKYCEIRIPFVGSSILMVTLNLLLFVPLGFLITAVFKKINFNYKKVLLSGCVFSCSIEFLQLFAGRFFEIDDIIANTLGTLIGYLFWQSFNGMRDKRTRGQALIKGMVTILSTISLIFCLSLVANNDFITEDYDKYSEMGFLEEEINDIYRVSVYGNGAEKEMTDYDTCWQVYSSIGANIGNNASSYVEYQCNQSKEGIIGDIDQLYIEVAFNKKHSFTFYNNQDLLLENINHIIYSLKDGTVYLSREGDENFTTVLKYENKEYPFIMNEDVYEMMDTLY